MHEEYKLVEIYEILAGTSFLAPLVAVLIYLFDVDPGHVLPIIAVLALPVGWLVINFQRFIFTFKGRYEHYPVLESIRERVSVAKTKEGYTVNFNFPLNKKRKLQLTSEEYERIFDPYKNLQRFLFWKSYRSKQPILFKKKYGNGTIKPFFVENIENMFFFEKEGLGEFIRGTLSIYHISQVAGYGLCLGVAFSIGFALLFWPKILSYTQYLQLLRSVLNRSLTLSSTNVIMTISGIILISLPIFLIFSATKIQSTLKVKESQANEELMVELRMSDDLPSRGNQ